MSEIEKKVITFLLVHLRPSGWEAIEVYDGGDDPEPVTTDDEVISAVEAVDESAIRFRHIGGDGRKRHAVANIILGNDGWDCIYDNSIRYDDFAKLLDEVSEYAETLDPRNAP